MVNPNSVTRIGVFVHHVWNFPEFLEKRSSTSPQNNDHMTSCSYGSSLTSLVTRNLSSNPDIFTCLIKFIKIVSNSLVGNLQSLLISNESRGVHVFAKQISPPGIRGKKGLQ